MIFKKINLYALAALSLLTACNLPPAPGSLSQFEAPRQSFRILFSPAVNGQPFACGKSYPGIGNTQSTLEPRDFRMYISNLKLIKANGEAVALQLTQDDKWQKQTSALLDFEDKTGACETGTPETNFEIRGEAPAGDYQGLRFELGLPFELNHQDLSLASSPLNITSMFWSWRGGYKFLRADMGTTGMPQGYFIHLGSTGCTGNASPAPLSHAAPDAMPAHQLGFQLKHDDADHLTVGSPAVTTAAPLAESRTSAPESCSHPNTPTIELPAFDAQRQQIVVDLGHLLSQSDINQNQAETAAGCMSEPGDGDCKPIFSNLGLPFADQPAAKQTFFAVHNQSGL